MNLFHIDFIKWKHLYVKQQPNKCFKAEQKVLLKWEPINWEKKKWKIEKQLSSGPLKNVNETDPISTYYEHHIDKLNVRTAPEYQRIICKTHNTSQTRQPRSSNQTRSHPSKSHKPHNSNNNNNNNCNSNNTVHSSVQALVRLDWCRFIASPLQNAASRDDHFRPGGRGEGEQRQADDIITRLVSVCVLCVLSHFSFTASPTLETYWMRQYFAGIFSLVKWLRSVAPAERRAGGALSTCRIKYAKHTLN